VVGRLI